MRRSALGIGFLLMLALLIQPGGLSAQVAVGGGAGLTFTNLTGDDVGDDEFDSRTGFYIGGSLGLPLTPMFGIGTGAYYVQKGAKEPVGDDELKLEYLEVPILLQVTPTQADRPVAVSLFLGPNLGFNLSCDQGGSEPDCSDSVKSFELGLLAGAGLAFGLGERATFSVNGGLDLGLTSISDEEDENIKNTAYFVGIGVSVPVGG